MQFDMSTKFYDVLLIHHIFLTETKYSECQKTKISFLILFLKSCSVNGNVVLFEIFAELISRSSRPEVFFEKRVLKNFAKFTGKHLCQSLFFKKVAGVRPATLLKKRLWHRCFPVNFAKFLITSFLQNSSGGCLKET